jgi:uncharacterized membrane protein
MNKALSMLYGIGLGAGLMYLFDPDWGRRRRALLRDKMTGTLNQMNDTLEKAGEDLRNRTRGTLAEARALINREEVPDWILEERARAELGRVIRFPGSIEVSATQGRLTLSGPVLKDEVEHLLARMSSLRGVKQVENQLEVHASAEGVPGLQGNPRPRQAQSELLQENWSPGTRLLTSVGGGLIGVYGMRRGGLTGLTLSTLGLGLALRGLTNLPPKRLFGYGDGRRAIDVQKTININAPIEQVYALWSNFTNFPRFMAHVREVRDLGDGRSHWKVVGPAGISVEWDAIVTKQVPNRILAWKSVTGEPVRSAGIVAFEPNSDGSTRITVRMTYNPPAGALGHAVASFFGADPKQAMDEDLVRLKSLLEEGKTSAEGREIRQADLTGANPMQRS